MGFEGYVVHVVERFSYDTWQVWSRKTNDEIRVIVKQRTLTTATRPFITVPE